MFISADSLAVCSDNVGTSVAVPRVALTSFPLRRIFCLLILTTTIAAACGSGDDGTSSSPDVDSDAGSMVQALSLMPQDDDTLLIVVNDYAAAGEALGLERPEAGADDDEVADW